MISREKFTDRYSYFCSLLYDFHHDAYQEVNDNRTVSSFIKESKIFHIQGAIDQAKEVLSLKEFPHELISDISNRLPRIDRPVIPQDYYEWVQWMVKTLEEEARKQGKLEE
jgi:hypothetical protein